MALSLCFGSVDFSRKDALNCFRYKTRVLDSSNKLLIEVLACKFTMNVTN